LSGDGVVSKEDMELIMRQAGGASLTDVEIKSLIDNVFHEAGSRENGLTLPVFSASLKGINVGLAVEVPIE